MRSLLLLTVILSPASLWAQRCMLGNATLNGTYSVMLTGTAGSPVWAPFTGPVATLVRYVFDGLGNFTASPVTIVAANPPLTVTLDPAPPVVHKYTVKQDCTGSLTLNFAPAPDGHYNFIVSPDGKKVWMISTDKGDVLTATATRLDRN